MAWRRGAPLAQPGALGSSVHGEPRSRGRGRRWPLLLAVVVLALALLATVVRVPYAILSPGPAVNTLGNDGAGKPLIAVSKHATYPTTGSLDFTTVSVRGGPGYPVTVADLVQAALAPHHEILPADQVFEPDASAEEIKEASTHEMVSSQQSATVVALRRLGMTVPETVVVAAVPDDSPARGLVRAEDVITAVDGHAVATSAAARDAIKKHAPGERVALTVSRAGRPVTLTVPTVERGGATAVGIYLTSRFVMPVDVTISAGDVGGPSAGTMFALGVYDKLTPGAMTGGKAIAGTGAIDTDGTIEPIGGIAEKMVAARRDGAQWFLAPAPNCSGVVGNIPDGLEVVRVSTFAGAVEAVTAIGTGDTGALDRCG